MHWLRSIEAIAPTYPAVWLVETTQRPRDLNERSRLRRETALTILARQLGRAVDDIALGHDPAGRPLLQKPPATGLHLSLATRAGVVAVALAQRPVGVDVEQVDREDIIPREVLHREELQALEALDPLDHPLAFAKLWAAKEAYVKALGTGFVRPPESFAVSLVSARRFRVDDTLRGTTAEGALGIIENGGQEILAAAAIVLDGA